MRQFLGILAVLSTAAVGPPPSARAADDEMVVNPAFAHWSAFKVGTTVTQKEKVTFPEASDEADYYPDRTHEKDLTYRLEEVTPAKVVVRLTVSEYGHGSITEQAPIRITYPAKVKKEHVSTSKEEIETFRESEEDLMLQGKAVHCHKVELIDKDGPVTVRRTLWTADSVPGGTVKESMSTAKGDEVVTKSTLEVVSYHTT